MGYRGRADGVRLREVFSGLRRRIPAFEQGEEDLKLGELIFELGFHVDTMKLKDFGKAVSELNMTGILAAGSFGAMYEGAKSLIDLAEGAGNTLNKFSRETGQSTDELQKWSKLAQEMGVDAGTVAGAIGDMQTNLFNLRMTGQGANFWNMLHVSPDFNNMFANLEKLYPIMHKLGLTEPGKRNYLLAGLGIPMQFADLFSLSADKFKEAMKPPDLKVSVDDQKKLADYQKITGDLTYDWSQTLTQVGISIIPIAQSLKEVLDSMDKNVVKSKEWAGYMNGIAEVLKLVAHPVDRTRALVGADDPKEDWKVHPLFKMPWQKFNLDGTYATGNLSAADAVSPNSLPNSRGTKSNITVQNTVHTSDPNTTIETTSTGAGDSTDYVSGYTIRSLINQKSAGTT